MKNWFPSVYAAYRHYEIKGVSNRTVDRMIREGRVVIRTVVTGGKVECGQWVKK